MNPKVVLTCVRLA